MKKLCLLLIASACVIVISDRAHAIKPFQTEFLGKYVENSTDEDFKKIVKEAKCSVCHDPTKYEVPGKTTKKASKKNRNSYGKELSKLLDKKKDKKDAAKIQEALKKVAAMKSDPEDESSKTFGELIKEGNLPVDLPEEEEKEE